MIIEEMIGVDKVRHFSTDGKLIRQSDTDCLFMEAVDIYPCPYVYTEYDGEPLQNPIDTDELLDILLGGVV